MIDARLERLEENAQRESEGRMSMRYLAGNYALSAEAAFPVQPDIYVRLRETARGGTASKP